MATGNLSKKKGLIVRFDELTSEQREQLRGDPGEPGRDGIDGKDASGARSATYYIGAADTPNNDCVDYICSNTDGNRFNDIIDAIMSDMAEHKAKQGSKIVVKNGTYYQNGDVNITEKCVMDFEKEFDTSSEGTNYKWVVDTHNSVFNNLKLYGELHVYGESNAFNGCWFVNDVHIGRSSADAGGYSSFRNCLFKGVVQTGHTTATSEAYLSGKLSSFIGCQFDNELLLACKEVIVKTCHFSSSEYGIRYNGPFSQSFTGYFSGNTIQGGTSSGAPLYDNITAASVTNSSAPSYAYINILGGADNWTQEAVTDAAGNVIGYRYGQRIDEVHNATITENSKVDLQIDSGQMVVFYQKDLAFVTENDGGDVTVYCVGSVPENNYTIRVVVTEVV